MATWHWNPDTPEPRMLKWNWSAFDAHGNHWQASVDLKAISPKFIERTFAKLAESIAEFSTIVNQITSVDYE